MVKKLPGFTLSRVSPRFEVSLQEELNQLQGVLSALFRGRTTSSPRGPRSLRTPSTILLDGLSCAAELRSNRMSDCCAPVGAGGKHSFQTGKPQKACAPTVRLTLRLTQPHLPDPACIPN